MRHFELPDLDPSEPLHPGACDHLPPLMQAWVYCARVMLRAGERPPPMPRYLFGELVAFPDLDAYLESLDGFVPAAPSDIVFGAPDFLDDNPDLIKRRPGWDR